MLALNSITSDAKQAFTLISETGEQIIFSLQYLARQQQWIFNLSYKDTIINGKTLTVGPNILRQYKNKIDFGLMVLSSDGQDPWYVTDFITNPPAIAPRITLFLLNATDVQSIENSYFSPAAAQAQAGV